jgi:phosphomannomutase
MRPDSAELAAAVINGLKQQGRDVLDIGQVTSDMIYFAVGHYGLAGGAMVTASHNPGADNGIKLCAEGAKPIGIETGLADIRDAATKGEFTPADVPGKVTEKDIVDDWITHALSFVNAGNWAMYNVAIDAGNGMAGAIIPRLEPKVPLRVTPMYFELDGTFPNHIANPLIPENLVDLRVKIKETGADFGIAFDGDGDRAVLVDEKGVPVSGTVATAIMADYFLTKNPAATILYNANCGRIVPETVAAHGGESYRTKVGHSYIKADMRKYDAVFAGEHSGHFYFRDNFYADSGLIGALVIIEALSKNDLKLSELADKYRSKYVSISETNFEVADKDVVLSRLKQEFADGEQDELDGLTVNYPEGWFIVRFSNTEPLLRLNAEATSKEALDDLVARVTKSIES